MSTPHLEKLLNNKNIVIVDPHAVSRSGIAKMMSSWGAKASQMTLLSSIPTAFEHLQIGNCPNIIISEYRFYGGCGLDILYRLREVFQEKSESCIFILVTSDSSVAAIAHASEEDVDAFILKPYTLKSFKENFYEALLQKENPNEYIKTIQKGKEQLKNQNIPNAIDEFSRAISLSEKPALAYYYYGHAHRLNQAILVAEDSYKKGLQFNKLHYKCLIGLYDALIEQDKKLEAYQILKRLSYFFPANPHRLNHVIRLAVQTKNFEDIENYYQNFLEVDVKTETLVDYVCAALVVAGKYFIKNGQKERGIKLLNGAGVSCEGKVKFLEEITSLFIEYEEPAEAKKMLLRFPVDFQVKDHFKALEYLVSSKTDDLSKIIEKGRFLLKNGVEDPIILQVLIEASEKAGHSETAENLKNIAKKRSEDKLNSLKLSENI